jgi:hypothetical protein
MALTYGLYPNNVFKEEHVFRALIEERQEYTLDEVVVRVVRRSPALTAAAVRGTLDLFMEEVSQILEDGDSVTTPLFKAVVFRENSQGPTIIFKRTGTR